MLFRTVLAHGDGEWEEPGTLLPLLYTCNMSGKVFIVKTMLKYWTFRGKNSNTLKKEKLSIK